MYDPKQVAIGYLVTIVVTVTLFWVFVLSNFTLSRFELVTAIVATLIPSALVLAMAYANWKTDKAFVCKIENDRLVYDPPTRFSGESFSIELDQIKKVERDDGVYKIVSISGEEFSVYQHYGFYFSDLLNEIESRIGRRLEA